MTLNSRRVRIAADSVCDLPVEMVGRLGLRIIPTYINIGDQSFADDGLALDRGQFYRELPTMTQQPQTAAPSPGDAEAFLRSIFDKGAEHIISLHVPANLSGTLNAMRLGAEFAAGQITCAVGNGRRACAHGSVPKSACEN